MRAIFNTAEAESESELFFDTKYISNGLEADMFTVAARTGGPGHKVYLNFFEFYFE